MPPTAGRVIAGRYLLEESIGRGAMGLVWRAHDRLLDRKVAVKEVTLSAAVHEYQVEDIYQRTQREARTAARLSHPGIVTVHDVAEEDGRLWIVMELVPSQSLDEILASRGPLTALRAGRIGQQLLAALTAAHAAGVLHRDVKPSNVLISPDGSGEGDNERAVLTDFGIAQFEGDSRLTLTGLVMGTPGFIAPERLQGDSATPGSDLWSLGATLYAAVEGHGPYERDSAITTLTAIVNEPPPAARSAGPLAPLIAALLRREPSARPTAPAAARMFAEILASMSAEATPATSEAYGAGDEWRDDAQPSISHALPAPTPAPSSTQTVPPMGADALFEQFFADAIGSQPRARRVRSRPFGHLSRKITVSAAAIVAVAAIGTAGLMLARDRDAPEKSRSAAESLAPTASAPASPLPPVSGAAAVVQAIDDPDMSDPRGYISKDFFAAQLGTEEGFTIAWPQGWNSEQTGQQLYLRDGAASVEIDLTKDVKSNMVAEAKYLERQDRAQFPGYRPIYGGTDQSMFRPENIHQTLGALWEFDWVAAGDVSMREDVLLFSLGQQSYTIYMTGPAGHDDRGWNNGTLRAVTPMLSTFDNLPRPS